MPLKFGKQIQLLMSLTLSCFLVELLVHNTLGQLEGSTATDDPLVDCSILSSPANGSVLLRHSLSVNGTIAVYTCLNGYVLVGEDTRVCQDNGSWSGTEPTCEVVDCRRLPNPANGTVEYSSTKYRGVATYSCDTGFVLSGETVRVCGESGNWNRSEPTCRTTLDCHRGELRLVGGATPIEGRVEICNQGRWGTVCDDFWDTTDAGVVCVQLGFSRTGTDAFSNASFGEGSGPIWLDNVRCRGSESRLVNCLANQIGAHNCEHSEDAGVRCQLDCSHGEIRLVGGAIEGRVEVCNQGRWGTVCDDLWDNDDASVVCGQLRFSRTGAVAVGNATFGEGSGPIWLDNVRCRGSESRLLNCRANPIGANNCEHSEDAGVRCQLLDCHVGDLRLVGGATPFEGRVEILCNQGEWGTVCDDFWSNADATVVCGQLGFSKAGAVAVGNAEYGEGSGPIWLDDVSCGGSESRLVNCAANPIGAHNCRHREDAGVRCQNECFYGDIRLVGGATPIEGRVEICNEGRWGTVCDDSWDNEDASVVCGQLEFPRSGAVAVGNASFGEGSGPIWLDDVHCTGNESRLINCTARPIGTHNCRHREDAGVRCQDYNECDEVGICVENATCINTEGSYHCVCFDGYEGNGTTCDDIDECALPTAHNCTSSSNCVNLIGSFSCVCSAGYQLRGDGVSCQLHSGIVAVVVIFGLVLLVLTPGVILIACGIRGKRRYTALLHKNKEISLEMYRNRSDSEHEVTRNIYVRQGHSVSDLHHRVEGSPGVAKDIHKELVIYSANLRILETIGQGEFGVVYKGHLLKDLGQTVIGVVAIKTLKGFFDEKLVDELLKECLKMQQLDHPNVLPLTGVCMDGGPTPFLVMPFMANGSLLSYLRKERRSLVVRPSSDPDDIEEIKNVALKRLVDMCLQVAKGMEYLASKRFIHRDLAARNCMIDMNFVIKVADFGLAEQLETKDYFRQDKGEAIKLPVKWLALESLTDYVFSEKSDVWAYGVTCWEIFSGGKAPYASVNPTELVSMLESGYRMEKPANAACSDEMYSVMMHCWKAASADRPTFSEMVERLSLYLESMAGYLHIGAFDQQPPQNYPQEDEAYVTKDEGQAKVVEDITHSVGSGDECEMFTQQH